MYLLCFEVYYFLILNLTRIEWTFELNLTIFEVINHLLCFALKCAFSYFKSNKERVDICFGPYNFVTISVFSLLKEMFLFFFSFSI